MKKIEWFHAGYGGEYSEIARQMIGEKNNESGHR